MTVNERAVVTLLKAAVTGRGESLPQGFELEQAMDIVKKHHIYPLVYEGALLCGLDKSQPVMQQLFMAYCKALLKSEGQMRDYERVRQAFRNAGIEYMPLKGVKLKALYPKPELRVMGDADILIRTEQYEQIRAIMQELGFTDDGESDHELKWLSKSLFLELHKRLIPSYNKDFYAYFGDGWRLAKQVDGGEYAMELEAEFVYLFTHFAKHFRDGGIGCRHVLDLWVYMRAHPELNRELVEAELKKLQLLEFYKHYLSLAAYWFEGAAADERIELISGYVLSSGSWGQEPSRVLSRTVRDSRHSVLGFSGKLLYIWQILFPSVEVLKGKYTVLQKAPWLLPVVWLVRPFYKLILERRDVQRHAQIASGIKEEAVQQRQDFLREIGLEYNF